jgi:hypothetical protein
LYTLPKAPAPTSSTSSNLPSVRRGSFQPVVVPLPRRKLDPHAGQTRSSAVVKSDGTGARQCGQVTDIDRLSLHCAYLAAFVCSKQVFSRRIATESTRPWRRRAHDTEAVSAKHQPCPDLAVPTAETSSSPDRRAARCTTIRSLRPTGGDWRIGRSAGASGNSP